ncbi:strictosidine synthase-related [Anaeramoeba flamelloides]|uniref:Strictosidine synthase-related n=1 Tax=Anaeramoeba flamelloides TaxID=1746091 RepID=A0AAV7YH63_9EUKA|nr:strictosidine synthase-related [Anaeramoeba flamelloides]
MNSIFIFSVLIALVVCSNIPLGSTPPMPSESTDIEVSHVYNVPFPEEVAVDPTGTYFLTGGNDGYLYKVDLETKEKEEILTPKDFNPAFFAEWDDAVVRQYCSGDPQKLTDKEPICGRVLGIKFVGNKKKKVLLANAYFGIFKLTLHRNFAKLKTVVSKQGSFINDVVSVGKYIFYTDTHSFKQRNQLPYVVMDLDAPKGRFYAYNKYTEKTTLLADDLYFANGIALSSDHKKIYISETTGSRIRIFNIKKMKMLKNFLVSDLPILTDNIIVTKNKKLLVPGYWRHEELDNILKDESQLQELLNGKPSTYLIKFQSWIRPVGTILVVDEETGEIEQTIFDNTGKFLLVSSVHPLDNGEFLCGSIMVPKAVRFKLKD